MQNLTLIRCAPIIAPILVVASSASATVMFSPVGVVQNTLGERSSHVAFANSYNGTGLPAFDSGVTDFDAYLATNPLHSLVYDTEWFALHRVSSGVIDWDLGESRPVDRVAIWNEDATGVKDLNIFTSNDPTFATATLIGAFTLTDTTRSADYPADVLAIGGPEARYVRFQILSAYSDPFDGDSDFTASLGEVVFSVPTPSAAALLGLSGIAALRRRRG